MALIALQLADLPFDADIANPQGRPLGTREQVVARLADLLPGTTFDDEGRGVFQRGAYQMVFKLNGDPPTSIGVGFEQPDAFTPLKRIVEKTGWALLDPVEKGFVDVEASRIAGKVIPSGTDVPVVVDEKEPSAAKKAMASTRVRVLLGLALLTALAAGGIQWYTGQSAMTHLSASIAAKTHSAAVEKYADRARRRTAAMQALSPEFQENKIVEQLMDFQLAERAYWNGVGDGRFSSPELLSNQAVWDRFQMPTYLPVSFTARQRDGYEFEWVRDTCEEIEAGWPECQGYMYAAKPVKQSDPPLATFALFSTDDRIRVRTDGRMPRRDDPVLK